MRDASRQKKCNRVVPTMLAMSENCCTVEIITLCLYTYLLQIVRLMQQLLYVYGFSEVT